MRRFFLTLAVWTLALGLAVPVLSDEQEQPNRYKGYGYGRGPGHMMDRGYGWGPGQMMGFDTRPDYMLPGPLHSLKPEDRKKWEKKWAAYLMETMELRKKIAIKRIELETLWAQPDVDRAKVERLSGELAELYTKRMKKCDDYVIDARNEFGRLGWACPVGRWQPDPRVPF